MAESKSDPEYPVAFMATYSPIYDAGKSQVANGATGVRGSKKLDELLVIFLNWAESHAPENDSYELLVSIFLRLLK